MADQDTTGAHPDTGYNGAPQQTAADLSATPDTPSTPLNVPPPQTGKLGDDIANILKGIRLPERRSTGAPKKTIENKAALFDTTLGADQPGSSVPPQPLPDISIPPAPPTPPTPVAPAVPPPAPPPPKPVAPVTPPIPKPVPPPAPAPTTPPVPPAQEIPPIQIPPSAFTVPAPKPVSPAPVIPPQPTPAPKPPVPPVPVAPLSAVIKPPSNFPTPKPIAPANPAPAPVAPNPAKVMPQGPETVVAVHTLKDDLQQVVHDQKISVVRAVSLEEDRRAREKSDRFAPAPQPQKKKRVAATLFIVLMLLLLGVAALFGVYTVMQSKVAQPQTAVHSSILFAESSVALPLTGQAPDDLKRALASARNSTQGALGSITEIVPTVTTANPDGTTQIRNATFAEFMQAIGAHPPDALLRALGDTFFFGIHTVDTNAPLFVIPVSSYDRAFAGMLAWETNLNKDLAPIFTPVSEMTTDQNGLPVHRSFADAVMRNYDVRALKDDAGNIKLYYSFPTQGVLVIAESPYSFAEVLSRLQAAQAL